MKFLCDNCKAKYQIADEKVAGKTVRMKCRKCGHQIEVRSAVTDNSSSQSSPPPAMLPGVKAPAAKPGLATPLSAAKPRPSNMGLQAQTGSALAGAFNKTVEDQPASSLSGGGIELSVTDEWYVAINGVPVGPVRISELRRKAATGAVNEESLCWQEGLEEWRPIRSIPDLAQLVREAMASGARGSLASVEMQAASPQPAVTRPSMMPSAPKQPAAAPARSNSAPPPPVAPAPRSTTAAPPRSNVVPLRPAASASFDDAPLTPVGGNTGGGSAAAFAPSLSPSPFVPPAPQTSPMPMSAPMQPVAPPVTSPSPGMRDPFGVDPFKQSGHGPAVQPYSLTPTGPQMSMTPSYSDMGHSRPSFHPPSPSFAQLGPPTPAPLAVSATPAHQQQKKGVPLWFWPILVLALGFGGGLAFLVYKQQQQQQPVVAQPTATATTAAPPVSAAPTDSVAAVDSSTPIEVGDPPTTPGTKKPGTKVASTKGSTPAGGAPTADQPRGLDLGNLGGGVGGPSVGPSNPSGGGGGGLDQAGVERVVSAHRAGVKRTCWERGGSDQKSSVNVTVTANVAPNGGVSSTSSTGDDPVVSKCIESQVKSWTFPAPGSSTTINIPFKFVRQ